MMKKETMLSVLLSLSTVGAVAQVMTIEQLFSQVRKNSTTMKAQQTNVDMARENIKVAKSKVLPDINTRLSMSYNGDGFVTDRDFKNYTKAPVPDFGNNFALEAQMAVYTGGALSSSIRMAEIGAEKAAVGMEQTAQTLCFVALGQYLELFKMDNQMKVYAKNIALTRQMIDNTRTKYEQGTSLKNDITRYELQLQMLNLGLQKLSDQRDILNHELATTLGISTDAAIMPDTTLTALAERKDDTAGNAFDALSVKQAQLDIDMAQQQTRMAKSQLLPKVALMASDMFTGPIMIEVPVIDKNFNYWYAGIGISYSISSLFKSNKEVRKARMAEQSAALLKREAQERQDNDMHGARVLYMQSFVDLSTQQKSVQLARQNYDVVSSRYLNQLALVTDMVDAENMLLQAELQEVNARIGVVYSYYRMRYAASQL